MQADTEDQIKPLRLSYLHYLFWTKGRDGDGLFSMNLSWLGYRYGFMAVSDKNVQIHLTSRGKYTEQTLSKEVMNKENE